jgi:hypothetical protein
MDRTASCAPRLRLINHDIDRQIELRQKPLRQLHAATESRGEPAVHDVDMKGADERPDDPDRFRDPQWVLRVDARGKVHKRYIYVSNSG